MNKKNFVFDFDGTLVDSAHDIRKHLGGAIKKNGFHFDKEIPVGPPLELVIESVIGKVDKFIADKITKDYRQSYLKGDLSKTVPFDDMLNLLADMKKEGLNTFIATFKPTISARPILERFFEGLYKDIITPTETPNFNPNSNKADLLKYLIEKDGLNIDETVMVGDAKTDIDGARELGMESIGILYGYGNDGDFDEATVRVGDVRQLRQAIWKMAGLN
jgi:phosphoglycolate phosphatase